MSREAMQQALDALQYYGAHASNCDYLVLLTSMPPQRKPCSCGLAANITALRAALAEQPAAQMQRGIWLHRTGIKQPEQPAAQPEPVASLYDVRVRVQAVADWMGGSVCLQQNHAEEPPEPASEFDAHLDQAAAELNDIAKILESVAPLAQAAIPPGYCVVKDEPVARMLTWRGPSHTPTPPRAARTYAEFPEDAALPANKEAYWENAEPLYAARPGGPT